MKTASSELLLLDVNVLIALAWPNHPFHPWATRRMERSRQRWATCAITQLGFIRLSSNPSAVEPAVRPMEAAELMSAMVADPLHSYLETMPSPSIYRDAFAEVMGHEQTTDCYLVALAKHHSATLLTFDKRLRALGPVEIVV